MKIPDGGECRAKCIENLRRACHLPIEGLATDMHVKCAHLGPFTRQRTHYNYSSKEGDREAAVSDTLYCPHKLQEV